MLLPNTRIAEHLSPHLQLKRSQQTNSNSQTSHSALKTQPFRASMGLRSQEIDRPNSRQPRSLPAALKPLKASGQQQFKGRLTSNDRLLRSASSYTDEYRVRIAPGKYQVEVTLTANRFLPKVQLLDRSNRVVQATTGQPAQLSVTVQKPGLYKLRVLSDRPQQTGRYQLRYQVTAADSVRPLGQPSGSGFSSLNGYGLVNAAAAVSRAVGRATFPDVAFDEGTTASGQAYFWGLNRTHVPEVWAQGYRGQGVTVAVIDDGINRNHPALQNTLWTNADELPGNGIDDDRNGYVDDVQGWNFVDNNNNVQPTGPDGSHGSFIAGVLAGQPVSGNSAQIPAAAQQRTLGVAPDAKLMAVKVMSSSSQGRTDRVAQGIRYAIDNGAKIVNISLGFSDGASPVSSPDPAIEAALQYARQRGVLVVMAAGNERTQGAVRPSEPAFGATRDLGIAVGAIDQSGTLASFSNPAGNRSMDYVTAPGDDIFSTFSSSQQQSYSFSGGTSFAAPHVAGIAALMLSANPTLTPAQIESILTQTAGNVLPS